MAGKPPAASARRTAAGDARWKIPVIEPDFL
jgi:hypothetical protein